MSTLGKRLRSRATDLTGQRFGQLVVIRRDGATAGGNAAWSCLCDCGNTTRTAGTDLRSGDTTSCGCGSAAVIRARHQASRDDYVGKTFGRLTIITVTTNEYPRATATLTCACGGTTTTAVNKLIDGSVVSCGCRAKDARPGGRKEQPGYAAAHSRVVFEHGLASSHPCVDCGKVAKDWSYDHADPLELHDNRGHPYSTKPAHYQPRCRSCHRRLDSRLATARRAIKNKKENTA